MPYDFNSPAKIDFEKKSNFGFGATIAALVMAMAAYALLMHTFATREWLAGLKSQAVQRAHAPSLVASPDVGATFRCPLDQPVLVGFDAKGAATCRALGSQECPAGQYVSSIDPSTFEIHCSDAGADVACPAGSYITEFVWIGEGKISFSCNPRLNPFAAWKFSPSLSSVGNN